MKDNYTFEDNPYRPLVRQCDDPHLNWLRIRNQALWQEHYDRRLSEEAKKSLAKRDGQA